MAADSAKVLICLRKFIWMSTIESIQEDCAIHRRDFLGGTWVRSPAQGNQSIPNSHHDRVAGCRGTAAILVQARPDHLFAIEQVLAAEGLELVTRDRAGRLVITLAISDPGAVVATLNAVTAIPGVVTAALMNSPPSETMSA
jgi:nitrate reductase NapAB chaperone NapD